MKGRLFFPTALALVAFALAGWALTTKQMSFEPGAKIWFEGTSNLHGWSCEVERFTGTITGDTAEGRLTSLATTSVTIPVSALECSNGQMNRRMRDALRASEFSNIQFTLANARVGSPNNGRFAVETSGRLTVAGTTRDVRFTAEGRDLGNGRYQLTGSVPVQMTQFGISPPTAMLGTMRTGDEVTVRFDVSIR